MERTTDPIDRQDEPSRSTPGVTFVDHTADVGMDVEAPTLPELFVRAALGATWLVQGQDADGADRARVSRHLSLTSSDLAGLLRVWLRELLHLHGAEALAFVGARFSTLGDRALEADVLTVECAGQPVREIKGVTLHELAVERRGGGWRGRVIFDV